MNSLLKQVSITAVALAAISTTAFATESTGVVEAEGTLRLRNDFHTAADVITSLPVGAVVDVTAVTEDGWYKVAYENHVGYVSGEYLTVSEEDEAVLPVIAARVYGHVVAGPLNVREESNTDSSVVNILNIDSVVEIIGHEDGWYETADGFLSGEYVEIVDKEEAVELMIEAQKAKEAAEAAAAAAAATGSASASTVSNSGSTTTAVASTNSSLASQVVNYAKGFLGSKYVYGGTTPSGFDCSGFTSYVLKNFGISVNRTSRDQYSNGVAVSKSNLQAGDLVFFTSSGGSTITHVALYIGNGQIIHASTSSTGVIISDLNSSYYTKTYYGARRVL